MMTKGRANKYLSFCTLSLSLFTSLALSLSPSLSFLKILGTPFDQHVDGTQTRVYLQPESSLCRGRRESGALSQASAETPRVHFVGVG